MTKKAEKYQQQLKDSQGNIKAYETFWKFSDGTFMVDTHTCRPFMVSLEAARKRWRENSERGWEIA